MNNNDEERFEGRGVIFGYSYRCVKYNCARYSIATRRDSLNLSFRGWWVVDVMLLHCASWMASTSYLAQPRHDTKKLDLFAESSQHIDVFDPTSMKLEILLRRCFNASTQEPHVPWAGRLIQAKSPKPLH